MAIIFNQTKLPVVEAFDWVRILEADPTRVGFVIMWYGTSSIAFQFVNPQLSTTTAANWQNPWVVNFRDYGPMVQQRVFVYAGTLISIEVDELLFRKEK